MGIVKWRKSIPDLNSKNAKQKEEKINKNESQAYHTHIL